jgi:NADH:ubiquinone oxidoreductase subunit 6 (subunit J)
MLGTLGQILYFTLFSGFFFTATIEFFKCFLILAYVGTTQWNMTFTTPFPSSVSPKHVWHVKTTCPFFSDVMP